MNRHLRIVRDAALSHPDAKVREAAEQLWSRRPRTEREKASKAAKVSKQQGRRERVAAIREQAVPVGAPCAIPGCGVTAKHGHHIISGSGNRRTYEATDTLAPLCNFHHDSIHKGHLTTLCLLAVWAVTHASERAQTALDHRIEKIRESRASREKETRHG